MIEEKEDAAMVSPTGGDPFRKKAYFLKPIIPQSTMNEPPFKLPQSLSSLPKDSNFDPKKLELQFLGWRSNHNDLQSWFNHLAPRHQSTWKKAGIYEAIFSSMAYIKRETDLIWGLAEKWCCETNTFMFPWGEATITLEDVAILGGFSVLGESISKPILSTELRKIADELERERLRLYYDGCKYASIGVWRKIFMGSGSELEHEAFLVFWLSRYVFHRGRNSVNKAVISIAVHLAKGIRIALAPAVLVDIYSEMSLLQRTIGRSYVVKLMLKSPLHLVQVWGWERIVELRAAPNSIRNAEEGRFARWNGVVGFDVGNVGKVLDSAGESFMWRPYALAIKNWKIPKYYVEKEMWVLVGPELDDELLPFAMFLNVTQLLGLGTEQSYLPHRVAMQFGFDQNIPCLFAPLHLNFDNTRKKFLKKFENARLYIPSRLSEADASTRYMNWWKESVAGVQHRSKPLEKKARKEAVEEIYDSPNMEESVQVSGGRSKEANLLVPPGFAPKGYRLEAQGPMDDDDLTISEALTLGKKLITVDTSEDADSEKLSGHDLNLALSPVDESSVNTMESKKSEKEVTICKVFTWTGKGKRTMNITRSKSRVSSNYMVSIIPSDPTNSLSETLACGSSSSLFEKQEFGSSLCDEKVECATSSPCPSYKKLISDLKAKVQRIEEVNQVLKASSFWKTM